MPLRDTAKEFEKEFRERIYTFVTAAFAFTAGLFWNSAITDMIKTYLPAGQAWPYQILTALLVTLLAVAVIFALSKFAKKG
jgi:hypothetical protein